MPLGSSLRIAPIVAEKRITCCQNFLVFQPSTIASHASDQCTQSSRQIDRHDIGRNGPALRRLRAGPPGRHVPSVRGATGAIFRSMMCPVRIWFFWCRCSAIFVPAAFVGFAAIYFAITLSCGALSGNAARRGQNRERTGFFCVFGIIHKFQGPNR